MGRAVYYRGAGGVEVIELGDRPALEPGPGQILVEVAAAGLNRADCLQRRGFYPAPFGTVPDIPGLEYAGTVAALGPGVASCKVGDRVMGIASGGAMSTEIVVHERMAIPVPEGMSLSDAAAVPEVFMTAHDALYTQGGFGPGDRVLVHAIGSGVGTAALQLILRAGGSVLGTSRSPGKIEKAMELGLEHGLVVSDKSFAQASKEFFPKGADLILDFVGAAYLGENVKALASRGRLVVIGLLGGVKGDLNLGLLLAKRATVVGTVLRSRPLEEKCEATQRFAHACLAGLADGTLRPVVDRVMPMEDVAAAQEYLESNQSFGKVVLSW